MARYIGLDAHSQTCTVAVMGPSGKRLKEHVVETNGKALVELIKTVPGDRHVCLEEGGHSEWLYEILSPHAERVLVVQPPPSSGRKSDSIDAWALAELVRTGGARTIVFKAPKAFSDLRQAVRGHRVATQDLVRSKNRVKAVYRGRGLPTPGATVYDPEQREEWLKKLPKHRRQLAELLSDELDAITKIHERAEAWLLEEASRHEEVKRLATLPGIGPIRAAQIVAIVVTPNRFRTRQQFWSYCGLGIVTRSSSDWVRDRSGGWARKEVAATRGLNRNRQPALKAIFKGAALTVADRMPNHPLHKDYQAMLERGLKPSLARVTIARRIASATLALWKKKEDYDPAKHRPNNAA